MLMQIADYLECRLSERNDLLLAAQYLPEQPEKAMSCGGHWSMLKGYGDIVLSGNSCYAHVPGPGRKRVLSAPL